MTTLISSPYEDAHSTKIYTPYNTSNQSSEATSVAPWYTHSSLVYWAQLVVHVQHLRPFSIALRSTQLLAWMLERTIGFKILSEPDFASTIHILK